MAPLAHWTTMDSPVEPVLSDAAGGVEGPANDDRTDGA